MRSAFLQRGHELDELRQKTERDTARMARIAEELETARNEIELFEQRQERDARHLAQMARQLAPLIRQELGAVLDSQRAEETVACLEREKDDLAAEVSSLKAERDTLKPLEKEFEVARKTLEQKVAELEAFRTAITTSNSWRLTAPLRGMSRLLKGR